LGSVALPGLKLDGYLLLVEQVGAFENDAEAAFTDLLADAIMDADDVGRGAAARHGGPVTLQADGRSDGRGGGFGQTRRGPQPLSGGVPRGLCQLAKGEAASSEGVERRGCNGSQWVETGAAGGMKNGRDGWVKEK
jgi:hypothetical protein